MIPVSKIEEACKTVSSVAFHTPLILNHNLSERYGGRIYLKREDLQVVRSYKIRGAYNKMTSLSDETLKKGVICASAGNHAQGVAFACRKLEVKGKVFMPSTTPKQKVDKVRSFGKDFIDIHLAGDGFDESYRMALQEAKSKSRAFIHPFNDEHTISGQGTLAPEILADSPEPIDMIIIPVGGGGLLAGLGSYFKQKSPHTKIVGVEPAGAPAMYSSLKAGKLIYLDKIDRFVDGAAVHQVGNITLSIAQEVVDDFLIIDEGDICTTLLQLYNEEGIIVEPAGAMSITALEQLQEQVKGKNVVCIISGGNNDITRTEEIRERSLISQGLKHYFIISFPQRAGALRDFLNNVLGPNDDITHFEYTKKINRESGPALVAIELKYSSDYQALIDRMKNHHIDFQSVNEDPMLFNYLV